MIAAGDLVGNLDEVLIVERLNNVDEQGREAGPDGVVELADVAQTDNLVEVDVVGEGLEQLGLRLPGGHPGDVLAVGSQQEHAFLIGHQVKHA